MAQKETVIIFGAHSDDFVIGAGGTIAKYSEEKKKIISIVFSYGENSHPWLKEKVVQEMRLKEAKNASKLLGCQTIFFDLKELHFQEEYEKKQLAKKLITLLNKEKPSKIFTHSLEDLHPDHKAIHNITLSLLEQINSKPEVYIYSIWNPVSLQTKFPALYINISKQFSLLLQALKCFRSQQLHISYPFILLIFRAFQNGLKIRTWFGEKFFRIR